MSIGSATPAGEADEEWEVVWTSPTDWPALTELISGLLEHPDHGSQSLTFEAFEAFRASDSFETFTTDTIKLRLTGYDGAPDVTAIEILGADDPS